MLSYYAKRTWPGTWRGSSALQKTDIAIVPLTHLFNNVAFTCVNGMMRGELNIWRNSYPAEEACALLGTIDVAGVPFLFPHVDGIAPDNIRCSGERIGVVEARYDWLYFLASAERRSGDRVIIHYSDGFVQLVDFEVPDFWPGAIGRNGELEAVRFSSLHFPRHKQLGIEPAIWRVRVPLSREIPIEMVELPNSIGIHIFAMTLLVRGDGR